MTEDEIKQQIQEAEAADDFELVEALMRDLLSLQENAPQTTMTDEELVEKGVDLALMERERELRDQIKQAEQDGDFVEAHELSRELIRVQRLQPSISGIKIGE